MTTTVNSAADTGLPEKTALFEAVPIADEFDADWQRRFLIATRLGAALISKTPAELKAAIEESDDEDAWISFFGELRWLANNSAAISEVARAANARILLVAGEEERA